MQRWPIAHALSLALIPLAAMATTVPAVAGSRLNMQLDDGALSVTVDSQSVANVVAALNRLTRGGCAIGGYVFDSAAKVSANFQGLPLRSGLRRLLKEHNHLLNCDGNRTQGINLELLTGRHEVELPADTAKIETAAATEHTLTSAEAIDFADTTARLHELHARGDTEKLAIELEVALGHTAIVVREQALELLAQLDHPAVVELLERAALSEADPELRVQALMILASRGGHRAAAVLQIAAEAQEDTADQQRVATQAIALLAQLESDEHSAH